MVSFLIKDHHFIYHLLYGSKKVLDNKKIIIILVISMSPSISTNLGDNSLKFLVDVSPVL